MQQNLRPTLSDKEDAEPTLLSPYRDEGRLVNIPLWAAGQIGRLA